MTEEMHDWLEATRIVPVLVLGDVADALPIMRALKAGGIGMIEVTLRRKAAMKAIEIMLEEAEGLKIGAGTVSRVEELEQLKEIGAHFAISPGFIPALVEKAGELDLPYLPGVQTISEIMAAREMGHNICKFFPAEVAGGVNMLKAVSGPFPDMRFCPTGGITLEKVPAYLLQSNVLAVGVSALVSPELVAAKRWDEVTKRTMAALTGHM